jgi:FkbM family methyltransferase
MKVIFLKPFLNIIRFYKIFRKSYRKTPVSFRNRFRWAFRQACLPWFVIPMTVQHKNGAKFFLSKDPIDDLVLLGIYGYFYDLYFPQALDVSTNELFLDIGAHHGFYTIASLYQYPGIQIISVEPDPSSVQLLRHNIELNKMQERVKVINAAFGVEKGTSWLTRDREGSWGNYLGEHDAASVKIQLVRIQDVLNGVQPMLVKSNSEGGEFLDIPMILNNNIFPAVILLFVHPERGNEETLIQTLNSYHYDVQPFLSSASHPRYICRRKVSLT